MWSLSAAEPNDLQMIGAYRAFADRPNEKDNEWGVCPQSYAICNPWD